MKEVLEKRLNIWEEHVNSLKEVKYELTQNALQEERARLQARLNEIQNIAIDCGIKELDKRIDELFDKL